MAVIPVELAGRSYQVHVGSGLLGQLADFAIAEAWSVQGHCRMRYSWATRPRKDCRMGRKRILTVLAVIVVAVLAFAWIDGGLEQQRMIEQPVPLPEGAR
jgi:hypothetical protein